MLDFLKKKNISSRIQGSSKSSPLGNDDYSKKGKSFIFIYCEKLQKLDSEFSLTVSKLNESKNSLNSVQNEIKHHHEKISSLYSSNDSAKKTLLVLDGFISQIQLKEAQYLQICSQISEKISTNNKIFEKPSNDLIIEENNLKQIQDSSRDTENLIIQLRNEITKISEDMTSEKKNISELERTRDSLKASLSQHETELETSSVELNKQKGYHEQGKEHIYTLEEREKEINRKTGELHLSIANINKDIDNLNQDIKMLKNKIEEKNYTKLNTHKETLDYERLSIPIKQNLVELSNKCSKAQSLIEQIRKEKQSITNNIELLTKDIQENQVLNNQNEAKQQNELMMEARLKGENQVNSYRLSETEKTSFQIENEYKMAKNELDRLITNEIELKSSFVQKMGEAQHLFAEDDTAIRQLTLEINELKVKIDMIRSKQNANKQLEEHLRKNEEEISAISSQSQRENTNEDRLAQISAVRQSIMPTILKLKKNKSRFLQID